MVVVPVEEVVQEELVELAAVLGVPVEEEALAELEDSVAAQELAELEVSVAVPAEEVLVERADLVELQVLEEQAVLAVVPAVVEVAALAAVVALAVLEDSVVVQAEEVRPAVQAVLAHSTFPPRLAVDVATASSIHRPATATRSKISSPSPLGIYEEHLTAMHSAAANARGSARGCLGIYLNIYK